MTDQHALSTAERVVAAAYEGWREEIGRPGGRLRVLAVGEEQIRLQFCELSQSITTFWTMQRGASLAATAATLDASLRSLEFVTEGRMLIPEVAAQANPLEVTMAPGEVRYARCPGHVMILNRQAFTLSGPLTAAGDPTVWICNDPRLVEQAVKAHEQLWAAARPAQKPGLTVRQGELLLRMVLGESDREIVKAMGISQRTLEREVARAQHLFGASGRVDLFARLAGVTRNPVSAATPPNPPSPR